MGINKTNDNVIDQQNNVEEIEQTNMVGRAIGTAINPSTGTWVTAVIEFDPTTGQARVSRTLPSGNSKMEAIEKFKILAVEEGVVV